MGSIVDLAVVLSTDAGPLRRGLDDAAKKDVPAGAEKIKSVLGKTLEVGGVLAGAAGGREAGAGAVDTITKVGQAITGLIPGAAAVGGVIGLVGGAISDAFAAITKNADKMRERVGAAFGALLEGSATAQSAFQNVGIGAAQEDIRAAIDRYVEDIGVLEGAGPRAERAVTQALNRAATTQAAFGDLLRRPQVSGALTAFTQMRLGGRIGEMTGTAFDTAQQQRLQGGLLAQGSTAREAADAATRLGLAQQFSRVTGISLAEAQERLAPVMQGLARAQEEQRAGAATLAAGEVVRTGREEVEVLRERARFLVESRGIAVDVSAEEANINRLRREGAGEAAIAEAQRQSGLVRAAREQVEAAQQGRALREQMRSPLEAFQEEQARLEDLRHRNAISQETFGRGLEAAALRMEQAGGIPPPGQQAFLEGTAATVSAINRARRDQAREDRGAAMAQAMQNLAQAQRESAQRQRDLLDFFRGPGWLQNANI